jgi:hypothetical protein
MISLPDAIRDARAIHSLIVCCFIPVGLSLSMFTFLGCTGYLVHPFVKLAIWSFTPTYFSLSCGTRPWKEEGIFLILWCRIPDASLSLRREMLKNHLSHQTYFYFE